VLLCDSIFVHCLLLFYSFQFPHYLSFKFSDLLIILKKNKSTLHSESKLEISHTRSKVMRLHQEYNEATPRMVVFLLHQEYNEWNIIVR
jgi:hypothetical protein